MFYILGYLFSFLIGFLAINKVTENNQFPLILKYILGMGLGLLLSGQITFYSLLLCNQIQPVLIIVIHIILISFLIFNGSPRWWSLDHRRGGPSVIPILIYLIILSALILTASFFPYGGWDAWGIWNLKARFIFLGGTQWRNMLDPALFQTSNHYPFLWPLMNVWIWCFGKSAPTYIPLVSSLTYAIGLPLLLGFGLYTTTKHKLSFLPAFLFALLPLYQLLSISQYADVLIAFFLLAVFIFFHLSLEQKSSSLFFLTGIFCGAMSFIKDEGLASTILISFLVLILIAINQNFSNRKLKIIGKFLLGVFLTFLPALIFQFFIRPASLQFENGLISKTNPSSLFRLAIILRYYAAEFLSIKWQGIWIIILCGILFNLKKIKTVPSYTLIVGFTVLYMMTLTANYFINTHIPLIFWLVSSVNRLILSLIPPLLFLIFHGILSKSTDKKDCGIN
ncbi:MAG: hypothetical protein HQL26_05820 [Candidatus Omnitrophica bacterium]|nr:hypothetical protein [Candidatus Omnitrophota bacterium]